MSSELGTAEKTEAAQSRAESRRRHEDSSQLGATVPNMLPLYL